LDFLFVVVGGTFVGEGKAVESWFGIALAIFGETCGTISLDVTAVILTIGVTGF